MGAGQTGDALIAASEVGKDSAAGGIRQGGESAIQFGRIFNHLVKYLPDPLLVRKCFL